MKNDENTDNFPTSFIDSDYYDNKLECSPNLDHASSYAAGLWTTDVWVDQPPLFSKQRHIKLNLPLIEESHLHRQFCTKPTTQ